MDGGGERVPSDNTERLPTVVSQPISVFCRFGRIEVGVLGRGFGTSEVGFESRVAFQRFYSASA